MSEIAKRLVWDESGKKEYETGIDRGVLYPMVDGKYPKGVAWPGLISVTESPSGAENSAFYADNIKYLNLQSAEEFGSSLECYMTPKEFDKCDGTEEVAPGVSIGQQSRQKFGMAYRTMKGTDADPNAGYVLHLIYGCSATPSERAYQTVNDSPEPITFSYEIATVPVPVNEDVKPTSLILIDSTEVDKDKLKSFEDILYGKDGTGDEDPGTVARLPLPAEIVEHFAVG